MPKRLFVETAESRCTSPELMEAIFAVSGKDETRSVQIWGDGPSEDEMVAIVEIVTKNGRLSAYDFYWGSHYHWSETDD